MKRGARPRQGGARLGQHFLTGGWAAKKLVESARIIESDTVLEIGPGKGALTKELLATGAHVIAVEKDEHLAESLMSDLRSHSLEIVPGDVRDFEPERFGLKTGEYVVAANIPYYITGEILRKFLSAETHPKTMALLVQKEVAERILARDGKESILSISVKVCGLPSIAAKVSRGNFSPPPSVDSAILVVEEISKKFFDGLDEEFFFSVVRAGFASKRKFLKGNLRKAFPQEAITGAFAELKIPENIRAEDIALETWRALADFLRRSRIISSPSL